MPLIFLILTTSFFFACSSSSSEPKAEKQNPFVDSLSIPVNTSAFLIENSNDMWIGFEGKDSLYHWDGVRFNPVYLPPISSNQVAENYEIQSIAKDQVGHIWASDEMEGVWYQTESGFLSTPSTGPRQYGPDFRTLQPYGENVIIASGYYGAYSSLRSNPYFLPGPFYEPEEGCGIPALVVHNWDTWGLGGTGEIVHWQNGDFNGSSIYTADQIGWPKNENGCGGGTLAWIGDSSIAASMNGVTVVRWDGETIWKHQEHLAYLTIFSSDKCFWYSMHNESNLLDIVVLCRDQEPKIISSEEYDLPSYYELVGLKDGMLWIKAANQLYAISTATWESANLQSLAPLTLPKRKNPAN